MANPSTGTRNDGSRLAGKALTTAKQVWRDIDPSWLGNKRIHYTTDLRTTPRDPTGGSESLTSRLVTAPIATK